MADFRDWTATRFFRATAEFARLAPDRSTWTEECLRHNAPRLVRYQRLQALALAFDVRPGFPSLLDGSFIRERPEASYRNLEPFVAEHLLQLMPELPAQKLTGSWHQADRVYKGFADYLITAYTVLAANDGVVEASGIYLYPILLINAANRGVAEAVRPIEEVVEWFITPDRHVVSIEELVRFRWPPDDLWEIDADNI